MEKSLGTFPVPQQSLLALGSIPELWGCSQRKTNLGVPQLKCQLNRMAMTFNAFQGAMGMEREFYPHPTPPTGNNSYHFLKIKVSQVCFKGPGQPFRVVGPACVDPERILTSLFRGSCRDSKSPQGLREEKTLRECGLTFLPKVETWFQREKSGGSGGLPGVGVR